MITIDKLHTTYYYASKERPQALVEELNSTEDACGWRYELGESPRGYYIRVFDEDNKELGNL